MQVSRVAASLRTRLTPHSLQEIERDPLFKVGFLANSHRLHMLIAPRCSSPTSTT